MLSKLYYVLLLVLNIVFTTQTKCMDALLKPAPLALVGAGLVTTWGVTYATMARSARQAVETVKAEKISALQAAQVQSDARAKEEYARGTTDAFGIAHSLLQGQQPQLSLELVEKKQQLEGQITTMLKELLIKIGVKEADIPATTTLDRFVQSLNTHIESLNLNARLQGRNAGNSAGAQDAISQTATYIGANDIKDIASLKDALDKWVNDKQQLIRDEKAQLLSNIAAYIRAANITDLDSLKGALDQWLESNNQLVRNEKAKSIMQQVQEALGQQEAFASEAAMVAVITAKLPAIAQAEQAVRATVSQRFGTVTTAQVTQEQLNKEIDAWMQAQQQAAVTEVTEQVTQQARLATLQELAQAFNVRVQEGVTNIDTNEFVRKTLRVVYGKVSNNSRISVVRSEKTQSTIVGDGTPGANPDPNAYPELGQ